MSEKEYIEREALFRAIENIPDNELLGTDNTTFVELPTVLDIISEQPTADVQEVRHGKNVTTMNPVDEFECSECGFVCEIYENIYDDEYTLDCQRECNPKFCPKCGTKMDEE